MSAQVQDDRLARAAWSRVVEPGDEVAGALVAAVGAVEAIAWLGACVASGTVSAPLPGVDGAAIARLQRSVACWAPRWAGLDAERDLERVAAIGGRVVVPGDGDWPARLDDLGRSAPLCLWQRGPADLAVLLTRAVAVIGARACTAYGERVAADLAAGVAEAGWTVVSGGAYGIDAVAHRAALGEPARTVAVLAGGLDRPYPAGNVRLLGAIVEQGGALVSEVPPGAVPSRSRFLQRNRVIAAASAAVVVVEAAWRSGALNTAGHAAGLLRPVGAVPGPVTSAASAGCHRLLREGHAVCVTDADEVLELAGGAPADETAANEAATVPVDRLDPTTRRVLESLPLRSGVTVQALTRPAGLPAPVVLAGLGRLELAGLARQEGDRWCRSTQGAHHARGPERRSPSSGEGGDTG